MSGRKLIISKNSCSTSDQTDSCVLCLSLFTSWGPLDSVISLLLLLRVPRAVKSSPETPPGVLSPFLAVGLLIF